MAQSRTSRILVVIPSRLERDASGALFLEKAVRSIVGQRTARSIEIEISVGIDPGVSTSDLGFAPFVHFSSAETPSQAAALNAAARRIDHDFIAFLEDDDEWSDCFLDIALLTLEGADFVSSTQLEVNGRGQVICVNDFPTPSGWIMHRKVWDRVGGFDEAYRFHLDNDWLGRMTETGASRVHLVESTAPILPQILPRLRPTLHLTLSESAQSVRLRRHRYALPLIRRLVHPGSGMGQIRSQQGPRQISKAEHARLTARYGRIPW